MHITELLSVAYIAPTLAHFVTFCQLDAPMFNSTNEYIQIICVYKDQQARPSTHTIRKLAQQHKCHLQTIQQDFLDALQSYQL